MLPARRDDDYREGAARCLHDGLSNAYNHYGLPPRAAQVADAEQERSRPVKCTIQGCPGEYHPQTVIHTVRHGGRVVVVDHVPAQVCSVCEDVLFDPETIRRLEQLLDSTPQPDRTVPLYEYAS